MVGEYQDGEEENQDRKMKTFKKETRGKHGPGQVGVRFI